MREIIAAHVEFPSNGFNCTDYLARPQESRGPGVVVIQEWWGLEAHIKDVTERFAREGYVALAPDLYHGKATSEPDEARKLAMELDRTRRTPSSTTRALTSTTRTRRRMRGSERSAGLKSIGDKQADTVL